jgi:enolase
MDEAGLRNGVANEGGYSPAFASNEAALAMLLRAIERVAESRGEQI